MIIDNFNENFASLILNYSKNYKKIFEDNFYEVHKLIEKKFIKNNYEIVIINNTNNEEDFEFLRNLTEKYENIRVIFLEEVVDQETAFTIGLESSIGDVIITLDLSLHPKELIERFLELYKKEGYDLVIGIQKDLLLSKNLFKKSLYKFYYIILSYYSGRKINYALSSCRLFSRKIINHFINKKNTYQIFGHFTFYPGIKTKNFEFSNIKSYSHINKKNITEKFDKAINLLMISSSFPIKIINFFLNTGILINVAYIVYILLFTIKLGIGSGWSSISLQNSSMFLMIFLVMKIFVSFYVKQSENKYDRSVNKISNEISSINLNKFKNITDYED